MHFLSLAIFFTVAAAVNAAASGSTYYVIGNPPAAELYNQYEQQMNNAAKSRLPAPLPLEITAEKELMGDQITSGMRLFYSGVDYYLHLNEQDVLTGLPTAAAAQKYRHCTTLNDTVLIAVPGVTLASRYPSGGKKITLQKHERIVRIFSYRSATFIRQFSPRDKTGWIAKTGRWYTRLQAQSASTKDAFGPLHMRIMNHLTKVNTRYDSVFTFFNQRTGQSRSIPYWEASSARDTHQYTLRASPEIITQLSSSTAYVAGEIEKILLGTPYSVSSKNGTITLLPRTDR